jgi:hypothetical protein
VSPAPENVPQRLADHDIIWLATTRPDGRPHLIAIWFVHVDGALWFATGASSVKIANLRAEPRVNVSLESGTDPLVGEGSATVIPLPYPQPVVDAFRRRFDWDIASGDDDQVGELALVRIDIDRWRR